MNAFLMGLWILVSANVGGFVIGVLFADVVKGWIGKLAPKAAVPVTPAPSLTTIKPTVTPNA
jgi:hypothetical protein